MVAHDIDHADVAFSRVVYVGHGVTEALPQVQKGRCRLARHAGITVRGAADHSLEQPQDTAHPLHLVRCRDEVHF